MSNQKNSRHIRLMNKFIKIFFLSFVIFLLVAVVGTYAYVQMASNSNDESLANNPVTVDSIEEGLDDVLSDEDASPVNTRKITTMAVFGVDSDGYRTDVTMLAFFHHETGIIDVVSIPRDTKVKIPDDIYEEISSRRSDVKQYERINSIPAYVSSDKRNEVSVQVLEQVFGIDIDYYVNLDLKGFRAIVDAVGPIVVDVPMDMEYVDLEQDLVINLKAGENELYGGQAEQLIRFRSGYSNADIGRIDTQHLFMKAFVEKILEPENQINMVSIARTVLLHVTTNFTEAIDYIVYLDKLSADKIYMSTLPGDSGIGGYYEYDTEATKALFEEILNRSDEVEEETDVSESTDETDTDQDQAVDEDDTGNETESITVEVEPVEIIDPYDFTISVQNGTGVSGLAGRTRDNLKAEGYDIVEAINYSQNDLSRTKIYAPYNEVGESLAAYFDNPEIIIDEDMMDDDIQVIIAIGEKDSDQ